MLATPMLPNCNFYDAKKQRIRCLQPPQTRMNIEVSKNLLALSYFSLQLSFC
jgi:hypothetical protein